MFKGLTSDEALEHRRVLSALYGHALIVLSLVKWIIWFAIDERKKKENFIIRIIEMVIFGRPVLWFRSMSAGYQSNYKFFVYIHLIVGLHHRIQYSNGAGYC